jgi:hypothetical protein
VRNRAIAGVLLSTAAVFFMFETEERLTQLWLLLAQFLPWLLAAVAVCLILGQLLLRPSAIVGLALVVVAVLSLSGRERVPWADLRDLSLMGLAILGVGLVVRATGSPHRFIVARRQASPENLTGLTVDRRPRRPNGHARPAQHSYAHRTPGPPTHVG